MCLKAVQRTLVYAAIAAFLAISTVLSLPSKAWATELIRGGSSEYAVYDEEGTYLRKEGENAFLSELDVASAKIMWGSLNIGAGGRFEAHDSRFALGKRYDNGETYVVYTPALAPDEQISIKGECFSLVFDDAAVLADGSTASVRVSFSNIALRSGASATSGGSENLAITRGNNVMALASKEGGGAADVLLSCDISFAIEGAPSGSTFAFSVSDIDAKAPSYFGGEAKPEQLTLRAGLASNVFVPDENYLVIEEGPSFSAAANPGNAGRWNDSATLRSGFAALAQAEGVVVRWEGACRANGASFGSGLASASLTLTNTQGGNIQISTEPGRQLANQTLYAFAGKELSFVLTPDEGYELDQLTLDGATHPLENAASGSSQLSVVVKSGSHTLRVSWKPLKSEEKVAPSVSFSSSSTTSTQENAATQADETATSEDQSSGFSVTFADGAHGTSSGPDQTGLAAGSHPKDENEVTATSGWAFAGSYLYTMTADGQVVEEGMVAKPSMITMAGDVVLTPQYNPVVSSTSGTGGSISPQGDTVVAYGEKATFTLTAHAGYVLSSVSVNGSSVTAKDLGDGNWQLTMKSVKAPASVEVSWARVPTDASDDYEDYGDDGGSYITYTVIFKDPDGRTLKEDVVLAGTAATAPVIPKRVEETFAYWDRRFDYVTSDMVVRAVYVPGDPYVPDYSPHAEGVDTSLPETGDTSISTGVLLACVSFAVAALAVSRLLRKDEEL